MADRARGDWGHRGRPRREYQLRAPRNRGSPWGNRGSVGGAGPARPGSAPAIRARQPVHLQAPAPVAPIAPPLNRHRPSPSPSLRVGCLSTRAQHRRVSALSASGGSSEARGQPAVARAADSHRRRLGEVSPPCRQCLGRGAGGDALLGERCVRPRRSNDRQRSDVMQGSALTGTRAELRIMRQTAPAKLSVLISCVISASRSAAQSSQHDVGSPVNITQSAGAPTRVLNARVLPGPFRCGWARPLHFATG